MEILLCALLIWIYYKITQKTVRKDCERGIYHKDFGFGTIYYQDQYGNDWTAEEIERYKRTGYAWQADAKYTDRKNYRRFDKTIAKKEHTFTPAF